MTPEKILARFQKAAEQELADSLMPWHQVDRKALAAFRLILERCREEISELEASGDSLLSALEKLKLCYGEMQQWLTRLNSMAPEETAEDILSGWLERRETVFKDLPKHLNLKLRPEDFAGNSDDSPRIRVWKTLRRRQESIKSAIYPPLNRLRKLFAKPPLKRAAPLRRFSVPHFVTYYLFDRISGFLLRERDLYLQRRARYLGELHNLTLRLNIPLVFAGDEESSTQLADLQNIPGLQQDLQQSLQQVDAIISTNSTADQQSQERFQSWFADTGENFSQNWQLADTLALPRSKFADKAIEKQQQDFTQRFQQNSSAWKKHFSGELDDWRLDLSLRGLQFEAAQSCLKAADAVQQKMSDQVKPSFSGLTNVFSAAEKIFGAVNADKKSALKKMIFAESRRILATLRDEVMPGVRNTLLKVQIQQSLQAYLKQIEKSLEILPATQNILVFSDLEKIPPQSRISNAPIKALIDREILARLREATIDLQKKARKDYARIVAGISESDQIVEYNFKAAIDQLEETGESAAVVQSITEGLSRSGQRINDLQEQCDEIQQKAQTELFRLTGQFVDEVQILLDSEKLLALKLKVAKATARERLQENRRKAVDKVRRILPSSYGYAKTVISQGYQQYIRLGKATGLVTAPTDAQEKIYQFLTEMQQKIETLPYVYQHLFENEPLSDDRFFSGRTVSLGLLKEDFKAWQDGHFMATAIVGERGSGRTTLLNFGKKTIFQDHPIYDIDVYETIYTPEGFVPYLKKAFPRLKGKTFTEIEAELLKIDEPVIFVVENIQNLFIKIVGGFRLIKAFLQLMSHTQHKVYWVLTCTQYSWDYLDKVVQVSRYFQRIMALSGLDRDELESIILKRHRITGYDLSFELPEKIKKSRRFRKLISEEEQQTYLKNLFFEELQEVSIGNISVALLFWQRAIKKIDDNLMTLNPLIEFDHSFVYQLPAEVLFTLGMLMQHEMLQIEEHALIFNQPLAKSDLLFHSLIKKGILIETAGGYRIHPFLYRPVVRALKQNNILH